MSGDSSADQAQWFALADSVLRREFAFLTLGAASPPSGENDLRECDEEGSDNPPMYMLIARARPVAHDSLQSGSTDLGNVPFKYTNYRVAVTSVARLTPTEALRPESIPDSVTQNTDPYDLAVSPRVDTLEVTVMDYGAPPKRWSVCGAYGHVDGIESPFWGIIRRVGSGIRIVHWAPQTSSWEEIRKVSDSIQRSPP